MLLGAASKVVNSNESADIAVAGVGAVVFTKAFKLCLANAFGLWARAVSVTGTPAIKIELEESYKLPTTEGAEDTTYWGVPDSLASAPIFNAIEDKLVHQAEVNAIPNVYARYKITGLAGNPDDTIVNMFNFMQEEA